MPDNPYLRSLASLFRSWAGEEPAAIVPLPVSGSSRTYYRLTSPGKSAVGTVNPDRRENNAFFYLSAHFRRIGLPVPEQFARNESLGTYLQQDLGDTTLFSLLTAGRQGTLIPDRLASLYREVVETLPRFQVLGHRGLDYTQCYPRAAFDRQSMLWDLNYFKYYFLKLSGTSFDEQSLEDDFQAFIKLLLEGPSDFFLYRDFQSRNIMVPGDHTYFIDYQGGRKGSPTYDLCSLLYDAKADLPEDFRSALLEHYLEALNRHTDFDAAEYRRHFYLFVYIRLMQALGAYGFRGYYEKKAHFLQSIPFALGNLEKLLRQHPLPGRLGTLTQVLESLAASRTVQPAPDQGLTITLRSFSYKNGLPVDDRGHGGGFVFDCRALPNPGRHPEYQEYTGLDRPVIDFLAREKEVKDFLFNIYNIVDQSVKNYLARGFTSLSVNFGCTGGRHRSVYCAEQVRKHLEAGFPAKVTVEHRELQTR